MPAAKNKDGMARIRPAWIIWAIVSFSLVIYIGMSQIASHTTTVRLQLDAANVVHVRLFRLFDDTLGFGLGFRRNEREQRPELGSYVSFDKKEGSLKFQPGAEVHILVSAPSSAPLQYEAMPLENVYRRDHNERWMTANLSIKPGVYRWPPPSSMPVTHLHAGFNFVDFEVASVGEPFAGEIVDLDVLPPLGAKVGQASVAWLWFGLFWPIFLFTQVLWAVCLCPGGLRCREAPI